MKIKVGDLVVPTHQVGKIVTITAQEVAIEVKTRDGGTRITKLTEEQAHLRGLTLEQLANESLTIVGTDKGFEKQNHYRD